MGERVRLLRKAKDDIIPEIEAALKEAWDKYAIRPQIMTVGREDTLTAAPHRCYYDRIVGRFVTINP